MTRCAFCGGALTHKQQKGGRLCCSHDCSLRYRMGCTGLEEEGKCIECGDPTTKVLCSTTCTSTRSHRMARIRRKTTVVPRVSARCNGKVLIGDRMSVAKAAARQVWRKKQARG